MPYQIQSPGDHEKIGLTEHSLGQVTGLRYQPFETVIQSDLDRVISGNAIGGPPSPNEDILEWTSAGTIANNRVLWPSTLCANVIQTTPVTGTARFRVRGYDQYGNHIIEETPFVEIAAKTNNHIYLGSVFSRVELVEFQSTDLVSANTSLNLGTRYDWNPTTDASNEHHAHDNLGVGLLSWLGSLVTGTATSYPFESLGSEDLEIVGAAIMDWTSPSATHLLPTDADIFIGRAFAGGWSASRDKIAFGTSVASTWGVTTPVLLTVTTLTKAK